MSEVNEKKARKAAAAAEKAKKDKAFKRKTIIIVIAVVLVMAFALVINSNLFYTGTTAVKIGDTEYSPAEYNFLYNSVYSSTYESIYQQYGDLVSYILDTNTPLDEQIYMFGDGTATWADYFESQTLIELTNMTILYDAAVKEGYTLTETEQADIDTTIASYKATASSYGYPNLGSFLEANFGKGADEDLFREMLEKQTIAARYSLDLNDSFTYTADELEAYYSENKDSLDYFSYRAYLVSASDAKFANLAEEERAAAAREAAEELAKATSEEEFAELVYNFVSEEVKATYEDPDATLSIMQGANMSTDISDWMKSSERAHGDTTTLDTESGTYVIMFVGRDDNHYNAVDVRHILVNAIADENGEYSEEALFVAQSKAEELLEQWKQNPTEENFAEMAKTYSEDTGSNTNGGLYEDVFKNQMVEEFDNFLFGEVRLPGDTAVVYGTNGSYAGYHVMYYVGESGLYSETLADAALREIDYNDAVTLLAEGYEMSEGFGMRFTGR